MTELIPTLTSITILLGLGSFLVTFSVTFPGDFTLGQRLALSATLAVLTAGIPLTSLYAATGVTQ